MLRGKREPEFKVNATPFHSAGVTDSQGHPGLPQFGYIPYPVAILFTIAKYLFT